MPALNVARTATCRNVIPFILFRTIASPAASIKKGQQAGSSFALSISSSKKAFNVYWVLLVSGTASIELLEHMSVAQPFGLAESCLPLVQYQYDFVQGIVTRFAKLRCKYTGSRHQAHIMAIVPAVEQSSRFFECIESWKRCRKLTMSSVLLFAQRKVASKGRHLAMHRGCR